ncbi:hypothetical protein R1flu_004839 [Riccia fluitans]|uniref:Uncharacterized protein n=1 Tax=Riccia fluitans TaxID=41844 RepID=A0ABD1YRS7_9MARC
MQCERSLLGTVGWTSSFTNISFISAHKFCSRRFQVFLLAGNYSKFCKAISGVSPLSFEKMLTDSAEDDIAAVASALSCYDGECSFPFPVKMPVKRNIGHARIVVGNAVFTCMLMEGCDR